MSPNTRPSQQEVLAKVQRRQFQAAPENLSFFADTAEATIQFIQNIRRNVKDGKKLLIDFSETTGLTAAGAVYLYSEIERLRADHGAAAIRIGLKSIGQPIKFLLRESGLLQLAHGDPDPTGEILPIVAGQDDDRIQEIVNYLIYKAIQRNQLNTNDPNRAEQLVGDAINEAMLNVKYHAYPGLPTRRWWLTCAIFEDLLFIALCDRGVGIPKTLPRQAWFEKLRGRTLMNDDGQMIRAAMQYTRSAQDTSRSRGLGTRDIQRLVLEQGAGHLTVISGSGHYRLSGRRREETVTKLKADVGGTVIQWAIPLQPGQEKS